METYSLSKGMIAVHRHVIIPKFSKRGLQNGLYLKIQKHLKYVFIFIEAKKYNNASESILDLKIFWGFSPYQISDFKMNKRNISL